MKASLLQRNVKLVALVLEGLYESKQDVKAGLAYWRGRVKESPDDADAVKAMENYRKALPKFSRRVKKLEELQVALKHEMRCVQCLADWEAEDDEFWLSRAEEARWEGYSSQEAIDRLHSIFNEPDYFAAPAVVGDD